jgi:choline kinase
LRGIVLAAGPGRRLWPLTSELPKTLLTLGDGRTILDLALENLTQVGINDVTVVTGFAAEQIAARRSDLERRYRVHLNLVFNDRAEEWNNAYSLWLAREAFRDGALLLNGDTVHPASIEKRLLAERGPNLLLAVDTEKSLGGEEMKVVTSADGSLQRISKDVDPVEAEGEYIGVTLIEAGAAKPLAEAAKATWSRDPSDYYEDSFQEFARRGGQVGIAAIGRVDWIEVDDHADLTRAREMTCRS